MTHGSNVSWTYDDVVRVGEVWLLLSLSSLEDDMFRGEVPKLLWNVLLCSLFVVVVVVVVLTNANVVDDILLLLLVVMGRYNDDEVILFAAVDVVLLIVTIDDNT